MNRFSFKKELSKNATKIICFASIAMIVGLVCAGLCIYSNAQQRDEQENAEINESVSSEMLDMTVSKDFETMKFNNVATNTTETSETSEATVPTEITNSTEDTKSVVTDKTASTASNTANKNSNNSNGSNSGNSQSTVSSNSGGGKKNTWDTYVGRFFIPDTGVNVGCYDSNSQETVDAADSAAYYYGNGHIIIADHWNQGFEGIKSCSYGTKASFTTSAGTKTYTCVDRINGHNTGEGLTTSDYTSIRDLYPGALVCYTCDGNWKNIVIVFFMPDDGNNLYMDCDGSLREFDDVDDEVFHDGYYSCEDYGKEHDWSDWEDEGIDSSGTYRWFFRYCHRCNSGEYEMSWVEYEDNTSEVETTEPDIETEPSLETTIPDETESEEEEMQKETEPSVETEPPVVETEQVVTEPPVVEPEPVVETEPIVEPESQMETMAIEPESVEEDFVSEDGQEISLN